MGRQVVADNRLAQPGRLQAMSRQQQEVSQQPASSVNGSDALNLNMSAKKSNKRRKSDTRSKPKKASGKSLVDLNNNNHNAKQLKNKNLLEELKIFQNSNLLNQQDPIEHLNQQLNQLIQDDGSTRTGRGSGALNGRDESLPPSRVTQQVDFAADCQAPGQFVNLADTSLSVPSQSQVDTNASSTNSGVANMFTIKKGILMQQMNQRLLFGRWKKRYFILTTDYLVCFKRSTSKVGHSEMGRYLYKTSLGDIIATEWLRQRKSDKGTIVLHIRDQASLFLWAKEGLDEWMQLIRDSIDLRQQNRLRSVANEAMAPVQLQSQNRSGIYENAALQTLSNDFNLRSTPLDQPNHQSTNSTRTPTKEHNSTTSKKSLASSSSSAPPPNSHDFNSGSIEREIQNGNQLQTREAPHESGNNVALNLRVAQPKSGGVHRGERGPHPLAPVHMINDDDAPVENDAKERSPPTRREEDEQEEEAQQKQPNPSPNGLLPTAHTQSGRHTQQPNQSQGQSQPSSSSSSSNSSSSSGARRSRLSANGAARNNQDKTGDVHNDSKTSNDEDNKSQRCHVETADESSHSVEGRRSSKQERPATTTTTTNLIRRDDSWQSLVSLTRVGTKSQTNSQMEGQQRSLYAQHIMPGGAGPVTAVIGQAPDGQLPARWHPANIHVESTATPLRGRPPIRQQSMQAPLLSQRWPPIRQQQQANSFNVAPQLPSSPSLQYDNSNKQPPPTSYHQKLLQLQLLHNSQNIDYMSNTGQNNGGNTNDYQIYGPGSVATTNHYGYYSMRSNLKSAASEFSFIRPGSSHFAPQSTDLARGQNPAGTSHVNSQLDPLQLQLQSNNNDNRASLLLSYNHQTNSSELNNNNNNNNNSTQTPFAQQHLNLATLGESGAGNELLMNGPRRLVDANHLTLADLAAPNRELPLKPNKKRQQLNGDQLQRAGVPSSGLGSSIVCFFKRAFSKRSKRRPKLAESCSSSLGAFDDKFESMQRARSAFSTSEGRGDRASLTGQQQFAAGQAQPQQQQRMIDLIEAFANKTSLNHRDAEPDLDEVANLRAPTRLAHYPQQQHQHLINGSPLHKSNSISTSTGLSGLSELMRQNERQQLMLMNQQQQMQFQANLAARGPTSSPMITRSTKVMSANLTPLFNRKEAYDQLAQQFVSPRHSTNLEHLPRPSSVYGQPSMISSPIYAANNFRGGAEFGLHRSSVHGYSSQKRDRAAQNNSNNNNSLDFTKRQYQMMKAPFLDTTREVAEEISSPNSESKPFPDYVAGGPAKACQQLIDDVGASPRIYFQQEQRHQRQAIVNPILQSPTTSLIYDNPIPLRRSNQEAPVYSHYDNHRSEYHQSMSSTELAAAAAAATSGPQSYPQLISGGSNEPDNHHRHHQLASSSNCEVIISPLVTRRNSKTRQSYTVGDQMNALFTPSRHMRLSQQQSGPLPDDLDQRLMTSGSKPSAVIAPTTPNISQQQRNISLESNYARHQSNAISSAVSNGPLYSQSSARPNQPLHGVQPSPMKHLVSGSYQQSPLVNRQTRVLKRGDGVQATILNSQAQQAETNGYHYQQSVNLEPSFAAEPKKGAFESSNADRRSNPNSDTKTFSIYTRLSKTVDKTSEPDEHLQPSKSADASSKSRTAQNAGANGKDYANQKLRDDRLTSRSTTDSSAGQISSSSSSSTTKSVRSFGSRTSGARNGFDSRENQEQDSLGRGRQSVHSRASTTDNNNGVAARRGSSTEHSDEPSSQAESIDEEPLEERNWVTSKLMQ